MADFELERGKLVSQLKMNGYVCSPDVERAMRKVPREEFLPPEGREEAYVDSPLPIGSGQTISAPHMVAIMAEALEMKSGHRVLEIGTGSGYHAAVCAEVVAPEGHVYTVERIPSLAAFAESNLKRTGYSTLVTVIVADGSKGYPEKAPYDRIFVAAGAPDVPKPLKEQLVDGGKLLVPVGGRYYQELTRVVRRGDQFPKEDLGGCVFVPLVGEYGY